MLHQQLETGSYQHWRKQPCLHIPFKVDCTYFPQLSIDVFRCCNHSKKWDSCAHSHVLIWSQKIPFIYNWTDLLYFVLTRAKSSCGNGKLINAQPVKVYLKYMKAAHYLSITYYNWYQIADKSYMTKLEILTLCPKSMLRHPNDNEW
jgi:hypothetical protein